MSALRGWLAEGTPQRFLTAAAVVLSLAMIAGLVVLVVETAGSFFWPRPLVALRLADGTRLLGEEWGREADPHSPGQGRVRLKQGNRDLTGADFLWVRDSEVVERSRPADAWLLERREYGNFFGRVVALERSGARLAAGSPGFEHELGGELAQVRRLLDEERRVLGSADRANSTVARLQLQVAAAERRGHAADGLKARLAAAQATETAATAPLFQRLEAIRAELDRATLRMRTASEQEVVVPLQKVVRAVPVNTLGFGARVGLYLGRWWEFVSAEPRESNTEGGIFPALFGTAMMVILMTLAVVPLGVVTAVYLNEYARDSGFTRTVRLALSNLAGVPSIVFGAFGLAFFVYTVGGGIDRMFFSDTLPTPTFGTGGILWAALTLALLTVPVVVIATEEGLQSVPQAVRDGARALGATRWQTLRRVVLPYAAPGILTGTILALARGAGEVAPLMVTGVVKLAPSLPFDRTAPFLHLERKFMHLGFHIYDVGFQSPNVEAAKPMVYATVLVLLLLVVALNLAAIVLRNRLRRKLRGSAV